MASVVPMSKSYSTEKRRRLKKENKTHMHIQNLKEQNNK